jgi:TatA/E family protein of Tat protein translocase
MMGLDNPLHIAFLMIVALFVFGAKRLPEMGRSLGSGMRGFKEAISGETAPAVVSIPDTHVGEVQAQIAMPEASFAEAGHRHAKEDLAA